jgi:hypothetical protein
MSPQSTAMSPLEPALEALLLRIVPHLDREWQGASARELAELEAVAGRALPPFYRWFAARLGRDMGPMRYPTVDFSAAGVLGAYAAGEIERHPRFLLIGYERDELSPLHYFYDLDRPARGDAFVVRMLTPRDESHAQFETFREMLAWGELWTQRIQNAPQRSSGTFSAPNGSLYAELTPLLEQLGFDAPIATGEFCGLYERQDATLICSGTPGDLPYRQAFHLGGRDSATLGQILSAIASEPKLGVLLSGWTPPLPDAG